MQRLRIGNKFIGDGEPTFVIAEVAASHEGDLKIAKKMIEAAAKCGADAVKFQVFRADELIVPSHPKYKSFKEIEFQPGEWLNLLEYAQKFSPIFVADVFDLPSLELMDRPEVKGYKVHLTNIANPDMLSSIARTGKPVFLATGGATPEEIRTAISTLKSSGNSNVILMHGYQAYPTKLEEMNLRLMSKLKELFRLPVGFLDHVDGGTEMAIIVPIVAIAFGACVLEKHITLDRSLKGRDYFSSLDPPQFQLLINHMREVEKTLGEGDFSLSQEELKYRREVMKNIVAAISIPRGTKVSPAMLAFKRSFPGLSPAESLNLLGRTTKVDIEKDEVITWEKVE